MVTFESVLESYTRDLIKFLGIVLCTDSISRVYRDIASMTKEELESDLCEAPPRAVLLRYAHSIVRRRKARTPRRAGLFTTVEIDAAGLAEGNRILARQDALLDLEISERCAVALDLVGVTSEERDYVLGAEFLLSPSECAELTRNAVEHFNDLFWVAEHRPRLVYHIEKVVLGESLDARSHPRLLGELVRPFELDVELLAEDVTAIVHMLGDANVSTGERLLAIKKTRACALLTTLLDVLDSDQDGSSPPHHMIMLTYNSHDADEVRGLHSLMSSMCDPARHHIWVDWVGIEKGKDPFLLTAAVILALSQGYVISLGKGLLGNMQRWELQSAAHLCRSDPSRRRLAVAKLGTLPQDAELPEVDPAVPHRHVDLRQDPELAVRALVDYLTA